MLVPELCLSLPTRSGLDPELLLSPLLDVDPEMLFSPSPDVGLAPESFKALDEFPPLVVSLVPDEFPAPVVALAYDAFPGPVVGLVSDVFPAPVVNLSP